jgi:threonine/homoserine/homoserine lactone efflux protein
MPTLPTLALFCMTALALLIVPGPVVLYVTARSAAQGFRAGVASVLGVHTGTAVHLAAAVAGLSALLVTSAVAFTTIRWVGAAYLIVLGLRTITRGATASDHAVTAARRSLQRLYLDGVLVNLLNPKTALFFLAFLPQFIQPERAPVWSQTLVLGLVLIALGLCSDGLYALAGARAGRWWRARMVTTPTPRSKSHVAEGGVLIGLGLVTLAVPGTRRP